MIGCLSLIFLFLVKDLEMNIGFLKNHSLSLICDIISASLGHMDGALWGWSSLGTLYCPPV